MVGAATGNLIGNHISSTVRTHLFAGILVGSQLGPTESGFTITGNQISAPEGKGGAGIIVESATNSAVGLNLVNNFDIGILLEFSSTTGMALNVLSNLTFGAELECDLNSSILASSMSGSTSSSPPAGNIATRGWAAAV